MANKVITYASLCLIASGGAFADYVLPEMGGGQLAEGFVSMKHANIYLQNDQLSVFFDDIPTPQLRALEPPDQFDPETPWGILGTSDYNFQYGWLRSGPISLPPGGWVWIEQMYASPGLKAYEENTYQPIFGTSGSSTRWKWDGTMVHNVYAISAPTESAYQAEYRVYFGHSETGEPLPGYALSAPVIFQFLATPSPPGDYDGDGSVGPEDYFRWRASFGQTGEGLDADGNGDLVVDAADYAFWRDRLPAASTTTPLGVPEPVGFTLAATALSALGMRRNWAWNDRSLSRPARAL